MGRRSAPHAPESRHPPTCAQFRALCCRAIHPVARGADPGPSLGRAIPCVSEHWPLSPRPGRASACPCLAPTAHPGQQPERQASRVILQTRLRSQSEVSARSAQLRVSISTATVLSHAAGCLLSPGAPDRQAWRRFAACLPPAAESGTDSHAGKIRS